jgi:ABC-type transport system substrate-binding protein
MHTIRTTRGAVALLVGALALAGCSGPDGGTSDGPEAQSPDVLTIAIGSAPSSLDPALASNGDPGIIPFELAYEPLILKMPDGSYGPGLATEWGYADDRNMVFDLTLREDVLFSDGTPLTAEAVKGSLEYYGRAGGPFAGRVEQIQSIEVTDPLSLRITLNSPNPELPYLLMQRSTMGDIISPDGVADPESLGTETAGAGQYMIDSDATVTGQTYTFVPNPNYWNPDAVNFDKVVVKVIADQNASLSALTSGQVDYTFGTPRTAGSAEEAGFQVLTADYIFTQVQILDRAGETVPALGDARVRQALNHALDRETLATALFGEYGGPNSQSSVAGSDSYSQDLEDYYPYDVDKAKELLAEAGYPDGFDLPMAVFDLQPGETEAAQAVAAQWEEIGVHVEITVAPTLADYITSFSTAPTTMFFYGVNPFYVSVNDWIGSGYANPHGVNDPEIDRLYAEGAAESDPEARTEIWLQLQQRMLDLAWMVPFGAQDKILLARPGLETIDLSPTNLDPNPVFFTAQD